MNSKLPLIIGGCVVLLLVCCVGAIGIGYLFQNQLGQVLGLAQSQSLPETGTSGSSDTTTVPFGASPTESAATSGSAPSAGGDIFGSALSKAKAASKYRIQFNWIFGGMQNDKYVEQPFFDFTGEVDGKNVHLTSKGGFLAMLGGGTDSTIEIIEAGGKEYMKGVSMFGTTDPNTWYIQSDTSTTSGFQDFTNPTYFSDFTSSDPSSYKKTGSELVDGQNCDVYLYDVKSLENSALVGLLGSAQDKSDFSAIDKAAMNIWLCGDGYVHKFTMDYEGHNAEQANSKAAMKMNVHIWDYNNSSISVQAPAGAKPMPK
ncbi:MAG: hypothetical protein M1570_18140 [Chloroflexi bacterium]|nr:hypothetical protein [Chloroflexota bacterium]